MPAFTFEKISPPVHRNPVPAAETVKPKSKPRSAIAQMFAGLSERRTKRKLAATPGKGETAKR